MQWVLFWLILSGETPSTGAQVFYSQETCEIAAAQLVDKFNNRITGVKAQAFCVPRTIDKNGAITLDK